MPIACIIVALAMIGSMMWYRNVQRQKTAEKRTDVTQRAVAPLGRIDKYELVRELGEGGFGTVYLAHDTVAGVGRKQ